MILVAKKPDLGVKIFHLNPMKYVLTDEDETIDIGEGEHKISIVKRKSYKKSKAYKAVQSEGLDHFVTNQAIDKSDIESRKQLYHDGNEIKKDLLWEKRLMPDNLVKRKHVQYCEKCFKENVEAGKLDQALRFMADLNDAKREKASGHNQSKYWADKALAGLKRAEKDKPKIKAQLEKIKSEL